MAAFDRSVSPIMPRDYLDHGSDVREVALMFARQDAVVGEAQIDALAQQAIKHWRLNDATFWQRVKYHARLLRATERSGRPTITDDSR